MPLDTAVISGKYFLSLKYLLIIYSCFFLFCLAFWLFFSFHCPDSHRASRTYSDLHVVEKRSQAGSSSTQVLSYIVIVSVVLFLYCCINVHIVHIQVARMPPVYVCKYL